MNESMFLRNIPQGNPDSGEMSIAKRKLTFEREEALSNVVEEIVRRFDDPEIDYLIEKLREKVRDRVEN